MKRLYIEKIENGVIYAFAYLGSDIKDEVLPEAIAYLHRSGYQKIVLEDLNGVDVEIDKNMTAEQALQQWEEKEEIKIIEDNAKREKQLKREEQKRIKAEHEAYVYHSVDEALLALTQIKPADLKSEKTSMQEAIRLCKEVMEVVLKCEDLHFSDEQREAFQKTLKALGCVPSQDAAEKFRPNPEANIGWMLKQNDIQFPLVAFIQLIDSDKETFGYGKSKMTDGGTKNSWIQEWLDTQNHTKNPVK